LRTLRKVTQKLSVKLNEDELRGKGDELAATCQEISIEESDQETTKKQMKSKLAEMEARRDRLVSVVSSKREYKDVEVELRLTDDSAKVLEVRLDTGEIINDRPPRDEERQPALDVADLALNEVAGQINKGALNKDGMTVTAKVTRSK